MINIPMIKKLINKLRDNRKIELTVYAVMILIAVFIFLITGGISCDRRTESDAGTKSYATEAPEYGFEQDLERRLERILSEIDGVGSVSVMITLENSVNESDASSSMAVKGVIVVADGADNLKVKAELIDAVKTVLSVEPSKINVFGKQ